MFQTLKAQNGALGDLEYVVRSSVPASDKVKATKKQPACTRCKMKKLKCIMEGDSCEKCMEGGVACSYRGTGGPERQNSYSAEGRVNRSGTSTSSDCISVHSKAAPSDESPQSRASYGDLGTSSSKDDNEMDTSLTADHDDDPCSTFIDSSIATPSFIADMSAWTPSLTQDIHTDRNAFLLDAPLQGHELQDIDMCFCSDLIIAANATMQVKLVWATSFNGYSTSSIDDMLQCQKNVLASCESFFGCKKCSLRSDYVVLVISMCREMVNGVKALEVITAPETQTTRIQHPNSEALGNGNLEAGGWRLDDDDEIEIIRHLIQVRMTKLKTLIGQLEQTVSANHASYAWIVANLRKTLDDKLDSTPLHPEDDMMDLNG